jgi:hypothetical protein
MGVRAVGSARASLLRPSILLAGAAALGSCVLAIASPAAAGELAPDPAPATVVRPDAYPAARAPEVVVAPAPTTVTNVVVVPPPRTTVASRPARPHEAATQRRATPKPHPRATPKPQRPLPFPTLAIKWFSGAALPAAAHSREVSARVALVLAALVLASALLVAGVAREAVR